MLESPRRKSGGSAGGGGRRSQSHESQRRSRYPDTNPLGSLPGRELAPGRLEPPSTGASIFVSEEMEGGEASPGVGVSDRRRSIAYGENDNRWAHR